MQGEERRQERLQALAQHTLHHFEETAVRVRETLTVPSPELGNVLANLNVATDTQAINSFGANTQTRLRELHSLLREPAIARVVTEDEEGKKRTYFVSRATPERSPSDGSLAVSYNATPLGRLAALPVGGQVDAKTRDGFRTLTVLERAVLHPRELEGLWDSQNSVIEGEGFGPFTIASLRGLLAQIGIPTDELDELEAALAEDRAAALVIEGLRRDAITKMELRDLAVLDQYQDEIFRLPISTRLVILGPPGTGKTTTLIKRLGQKLDWPNLTDDERDTVLATVAGQASHETSWLMFTPTSLLEQYIERAFARENVAAPDDRIQTWEDCRRHLARNQFPVLRSASGRGSYVMKESSLVLSLLAQTVHAQRSWFEDFQAWQLETFWADLRAQGEILVADTNLQVSRLGSHVLEALPENDVGLNAGVFPLLETLAESVEALIANLKEATDKALRSSIAQEFRKDPGFLEQLVAVVGALEEADEAEDAEAEDEEDAGQVRVGREAAVEALTRALRAKARAISSDRGLGRQTRNGRLIEWLGARGPDQDELRTLGANLQVQSAARRFLHPVRRLIDGIPRRYRRYRRERQSEGRWYRPEGFAAGELNPLEVDVVLLAILGTSSALLADRRIARGQGQGIYAPLAPMIALFRNQVLVDEATDFSPVQLACMAALCDPASRSFVACGDFNQRVTEWGARSVDDLRWVFPDFDVRSVSITYRHSRQLNELARSIAVISSPDAAEAQLPQRVNNDGFEPVLATNLEGAGPVAAWLAQRIEEIERLADSIPPIAVLVSDEEEVGPIADALNAALTSRNLRAVACRSGQLAGQDNDVRVFDVQHIKGLEFEAVFFVGIDRLAERYPDLFEKFLYVGATRAAMYLGLTTGASTLPHKVAALDRYFKASWP